MPAPIKTFAAAMSVKPLVRTVKWRGTSGCFCNNIKVPIRD